MQEIEYIPMIDPEPKPKHKYECVVQKKFFDVEEDKSWEVGENYISDDVNRVRELATKEFILINKAYSGKIKTGRKIILHMGNVAHVGGIETMNYNLMKLYPDANITFLFGVGDAHQILRLSEDWDVVRDNGIDTHQCDLLILDGFDSSVVLPRVDYKEVWQMVHADLANGLACGHFNDLLPYYYTNADKIVAVSDVAKKGIKQVMDIDAEVMTPPIYVNRKKPMRFLTLSRATEEKGIDKILEMVKKFDRQGRDFIWIICTDLNVVAPDVLSSLKMYPQVILCNSSSECSRLILDCDYLVQLSMHESFCYSVRESLMLGRPVIVTDIPTFKFIKQGREGYVLKTDMSNFDDEMCDKIFNMKPRKVKYEPNNTDWDAIMNT